MQVIPFVQPPKKEWHEKMEKKARLELSDSDDSYDSDNMSFYSNDSAESVETNESEEEFDLQKHLADLLPGDLVDGMKPTKKANDAHLADLRVTKKKKDKYRIFKMCYRAIKAWRAKERERRKHHIIAEFEAKVRLLDERLKVEIAEDIKAHKIAVALEAYRTEQRIKKNSKVKVQKATLIAQFTKDLDRRDKEKQTMDYYCHNLKNWAQEGYAVVAERERAVQRAQEEKERVAAERAEAQQKRAVREADAKLLEDDKALSGTVNDMMVRYGMVGYEARTDLTVEENVDNILKKKPSRRSSARFSAADDDTWGSHSAADHSLADYSTEMTGDPTLLRLTLRNDVDLVEVGKSLKRNKYRRSRGKNAATPFRQDLSSTGDITTVKGVHIKEAGALSFAAELTRGACPMLETLSMKDCQIRTEGVGMLLQGIKMANLLSIRVLDLRGNFIGHKGVEYLREICPSGVFLNLQVLDLGDNELGDRGLDSVLSIILEGHFANLAQLHLQRNGISSVGFGKLVRIMKSVAETKCPVLLRLGVENNLVSAATKRKFAPYPHYFSL